MLSKTPDSIMLVNVPITSNSLETSATTVSGTLSAPPQHPSALSDRLIEILPDDEESRSSSEWEGSASRLSQVRTYNLKMLFLPV